MLEKQAPRTERTNMHCRSWWGHVHRQQRATVLADHVKGGHAIYRHGDLYQARACTTESRSKAWCLRLVSMFVCRLPGNCHRLLVLHECEPGTRQEER